MINLVRGAGSFCLNEGDSTIRIKELKMITRTDFLLDEPVQPSGRTRREFIRRVISAGALTAAAGSRFDGPVRAKQPEGIRSFDHVSLPMENTQAMVGFYRGLGLDVVEDGTRCHVRFGDRKIHFHQPHLWRRETFTLRGPTAKPGCGDLCFVWEGTPESLKTVLDRTGADIIEGPVQREGGRDRGTAIGTSVYVRDPDRNLLEFIIY